MDPATSPMNFTRRKRIALELLGPPLLGVIYFAANMVLVVTHPPPGTKASPLTELFIWTMVMVANAYFWAGIPSLIYMLIMEWCFAHGLDPQSWLSVGLSSALGFLSGVCVNLLLDAAHTFGSPFPAIGVAVGFALGWLIRRLSEPKPARAGL